jgi:hypothetical protein
MLNAKERMADAGAARVIYNPKRGKNKWHGIIAAARKVCDAICPFGEGVRLILRQRVGGSARALRAVRNTRVFQTETSIVADAAG